MGRRERVIDPSAGPVAEFAYQLRQLRERAGRPTYRQLEETTHYSATALSRAAAGERLPSRDVTLAFVAACGGDVAEWGRRWSAAKTESDPHPDRAVPDAQDPAAPIPAATIRPFSRRHALPSWLRRTGFATAMIASVFVLVAGGDLRHAGAGRGTSAGSIGRDPTWSDVTQNTRAAYNGAQVEPPTALAPEPMDGDDPRARNCYADAVVRQVVPFYLPGGTKFGDLRLRHSARCGASWASAYYSNPNLYTVKLAVHRPADGAIVVFDWANNTPPGSYADMLSTGTGCVWVEARVVSPAGTGPTARTGCDR
jgi:Helix-turn-helix domain